MLCIKMRIQGLFRNVPASNSLPLASPILHFPPAGLILGWVPHISALDTLALRDHAAWMVMRNHRLCSWYRCPWLVCKRLRGYTQLSQWVQCHVDHGLLYWGVFDSSMDCSKRQKKRLHVNIQPWPGLHLCPSTFQPPNHKNQFPVLEYLFSSSEELGLWGTLEVTWKFL